MSVNVFQHFSLLLTLRQNKLEWLKLANIFAAIIIREVKLPSYEVLQLLWQADHACRGQTPKLFFSGMSMGRKIFHNSDTRAASTTTSDISAFDDVEVTLREGSSLTFLEDLVLMKCNLSSQLIVGNNKLGGALSNINQTPTNNLTFFRRQLRRKF